MLIIMRNFTWQQWAIIIETGIIIILMSLIFLSKLKSIKAFIKWIKPSAEGEHNTASGRRLTAFLIALTYVASTFAFYSYAFSRSSEHLIAPMIFIWKFVADILFVGLLWGFINQQTLVALKNGPGNFFNKKETETVKTTSTTTNNTNNEPED